MASYITQPLNQQTFIDPYSSNLFDMGVQDSRVYLSRQVNSILKSFGDDIVICGLETQAILTNNLLKITIQPGKAIIDSTLHIFNTITELELDLTPYDESGFLTISLTYKYIQTMQNNRPYIKLSYITSDGQVQVPDSWSPMRDRLVIDVYRFQKDISNNVISIYLQNEIVQISDYFYIPRAGFFNNTTINNSCMNFIYNSDTIMNGGTFFDLEENYMVFDSGSF